MSKQHPHIKIQTFKRQQGVQVAPRPPYIPQPTGWYYRRELRNTDEGHFKFYKVEVEEMSVGRECNYLVTFTWGRIGTAGSKQASTFADQKDALKLVDTKIGEKLGKGYKELTGEAIYPASVTEPFIPREFTETPESQEKFDLFLNNLKL